MKTIAFVAALVLGARPAVAGDPVVLEAPAEATKAEVDQCAAALGKRLLAVGCKNLKAAGVEKDCKRTVEVTSKDAIGDDVRAKIGLLAKFTGKKGEFRLFRGLKPGETEEEFKTPSNTRAGKAPPGSHWSRKLTPDLSPCPDYRLLHDTPTTAWSETSVVSKSDAEWKFQFTPAATKKLQADVNASNPSGKPTGSAGLPLAWEEGCCEKLVDINFQDSGKGLKGATFTLPGALAENLDAILRNPMPRALALAAAK
jgi:hypothetical protein